MNVRDRFQPLSLKLRNSWAGAVGPEIEMGGQKASPRIKAKECACDKRHCAASCPAGATASLPSPLRQVGARSEAAPGQGGMKPPREVWRAETGLVFLEWGLTRFGSNLFVLNCIPRGPAR